MSCLGLGLGFSNDDFANIVADTPDETGTRPTSDLCHTLLLSLLGQSEPIYSDVNLYTDVTVLTSLITQSTTNAMFMFRSRFVGARR